MEVCARTRPRVQVPGQLEHVVGGARLLVLRGETVPELARLPPSLSGARAPGGVHARLVHQAEKVDGHLARVRLLHAPEWLDRISSVGKPLRTPAARFVVTNTI